MIGADLKPGIYVDIDGKRERLVILTWGDQPISDPEFMDTVCCFFAQFVRERNIQVIVGGETAGIPYAANLAHMTETKFVYCRKDNKKYGSQKKLEGHFQEGMRAVFVDNFLFSGGTAEKMVKAIQREGLVVDDIFVIEQFSDILEKPILKEKNVVSICTTPQKVELLNEHNYFPQELYPYIIDSIRHPLRYYEGSETYAEYLQKLKQHDGI